MDVSFEPYKIKMVETIPLTTREERIEYLKEVKFNPNTLKSSQVTIDLLTDSGTSAMSDTQWADIIKADESYMGTETSSVLHDKVREITGFNYIILVHQGRAAEQILFYNLLSAKKYALSNNFFVTTKENVKINKAEATDLIPSSNLDPNFQGNICLEKLEERLELNSNQIGVVVITVTNESRWGQPVSMQNITNAACLCRKYNVPFFLDACRYAENCWFIKTRDPHFKNHTVRQIALEMFSYADGCIFSAKKDGLSNTGGFLAMQKQDLYEQCAKHAIVTEGYLSYGGMAGRDLGAMAVGLEEALQESYLRHRIVSVKELGEMLSSSGVPVLPPSGSAVYIEAAKLFPHIPFAQFPAWTLLCVLYIEGGIRAQVFDGVLFGNSEEYEIVRLSIPRRVYTKSHFGYVAEVLGKIVKNANDIQGMKFVKCNSVVMRHLSIEMAPVVD